jgi:sRNA-binding regulator protein Hfq
MVTQQTRVWHPKPASANGTARRTERASERTPSKAPEPDLLLQGRYIRVHLVTGEVITGTLRRTSTYLLVLETSQGAQVSLYKHGVLYLEEA